MLIIRTVILPLSLAMVTAIAVSACQTNKDIAGPPIANGKWASSDGVYTADFNNGRFIATANDTGNVISQGNYVVLSKTKLSITWTGAVSNTQNRAECIKPSDHKMDCVDRNGSSFSLTRNG